MRLKTILNETISAESEEMRSFSKELYDVNFKKYFQLMQEFHIYEETADTVKLSSEDLERVLTELPMDLFYASENINKLRLELEVLKLKLKRLRREVSSYPDSVELFTIGPDNDISLEDQLFGVEILVKIYESVISRAENERSACKEFIMGAKKLWDSRKSAEQSNPVKEVVPDEYLPDYHPMSGKSYIR